MRAKMTLRDALRATLWQEMEKNPDMFMMGESFYYVGTLFSKIITPEFHKTFGKERIRETPVAEDGIIGLSFGAALAGMTAVPEIYSADFFHCIGNEIVNDLPKWRFQHQYKDPIRLVVRAPFGKFLKGGGGSEHTQSIEAYFHNAPGLTIVIPSTPGDAVGLMRSALTCGNPVIYLEHRCVYDVEEEIDMDQYFTTPIGKADVIKEGKDLTIVGWGMMRHRAMRAALGLEAMGISAEVIDPRTVKPMDFETIAQSVKKTKRLLVAEETQRTGSISGEIIVRTMEALGNAFTAKRLTMPDVPSHYVPEIEAATIPDEAAIVKGAKELL